MVPGSSRDLADTEIDLPPLKRQHLAVDPPAGNVGKSHDRAHSLRQVRQYGLVFLVLEETHADVVLAQHWNVRLAVQSSAFHRQAEHTLEYGQLAIDLAC